MDVAEVSMQDDESKNQLEDMLRRHMARERASIRIGFPLAIAAAVFLIVYFIVWRVNAGPVEKALVEIMSRRIELPKSNLNHPIDGAPLLEEQWGRDSVPAPLFADRSILDLVVIDKAGQSQVFAAQGGEHCHLIVAAHGDLSVDLLHRVLHPLLASGRKTLWLATKTPHFVGPKNEEIPLEPHEMSELGVAPVAVVGLSSDPPSAGTDACSVHIAPAATVADIIPILEDVYRSGKRSCFLLIREGQAPPSPPSE
ncbi:MAG: hypothetical protein AB1696_22670 [Planctomycetota bacterium]